MASSQISRAAWQHLLHQHMTHALTGGPMGVEGLLLTDGQARRQLDP